MAFYEIIIRLYFLAVVLASPFSSKARKWVMGRRNLLQELSLVDFSQKKWVWFLYSSYGEFQDGRYLMEAFRKQNPEYSILITFFSSTGYDLAKNYKGADYICPLPLDTKRNAEFVLDKIRPHSVFFIRNDIWPNYVYAIARRNIPVFLAIFALNAESKFLKFPMGAFYRRVFQKFTGIFVQDEDSAKLLKEKEFNKNIITAGNSRIDRVIEIADERFRDEKIEKFVSGDFCCIAGSTHIDDRKLFIKTFLQLQSENIKWIIVPHEIDQRENKQAKALLGERIMFYTENEERDKNAKLLWVDHVGMLAQLYRYADVVFIGGGFDRGGIHSIVEPLVYGCPVCFGPENRGYKEVIDLGKSGGTEVVHDSNQLSAFILKYKRNPQLLNQVKYVNRNYLLQHSGASFRILSYLKEKNYV